MGGTIGRKFWGIGTGRPDIDQPLGGGISWGSLVLVEGAHATGKTVLGQHLAWDALRQGAAVAYYSAEDPSPSLLSRSAALGLDMLDYFLLDRLRIYPLRRDNTAPPQEALDQLLRHISNLPSEFRLVVVDSLGGVTPRLPRAALAQLLAQCLQLCADGRIVALSPAPNPALRDLLWPLPADCVWLRLSLATVTAGKVFRRLEMAQPGQHPEWLPPSVIFDVEPNLGIRVVPLRQCQA
ncbi:MAG: hypothetical protein FJ316_12915 [SAR202 cluster bacterium]|nr:hypothetical protein [SAR202 cluster bacterium]